MANGIIPVSWGKELRPSAVNSLDKINEVIHFINQSDIHEFTFSDSGSGESVQTANSTQLLDLTVYGKSVQDGTPTPDNPVPVQVVGGRNLLNDKQMINFVTSDIWVSNGLTFELRSDGGLHISGTNTASTTTYLDGNFRRGFITGVVPKNGPYTVSTKAIGNTENIVTTVMYRTPVVDNTKVPLVQGNYITVNLNIVSLVPGNIFCVNYGVLANATVDVVLYPQLEAGTQATPYIPYGCIGIQTGETITPIDMQGHTLAGLPDGTRDMLFVDSAGRVWIEQNVGRRANGEQVTWITPQSDETISFRAIEDTGGQYAYSNVAYIGGPNTGKIAFVDKILWMRMSASVVGNTAESITAWLDANCELYYIAPAPTTIELGTITPPAIPDGSIIKINASLTPVIDVEWFTEDTLPKMMNSILELIKSLHPDDFPANRESADLVHSISPLTQISDMQPIDDIQPIDEIQPITDMGKIEKLNEEIENESEVQ